MVSQVVAILLLILGRDHLQQFFVLGTSRCGWRSLTAVVSAMDYYRRFNHVLTARRQRAGARGGAAGTDVSAAILTVRLSIPA